MSKPKSPELYASKFRQLWNAEPASQLTSDEIDQIKAAIEILERIDREIFAEVECLYLQPTIRFLKALIEES